MRKTFVIKVLYGGLGDHLFYSHLPRIAKQNCGYERVLVSNQSEFRNQEYKRLVWESNPFVDGFTDEDAPYPFVDRIPPGTNLLDGIMRCRGLDDGKSFHEPEVFFSPPKDSSLVNATVYDPNYVSYVGSLNPEHVEQYFEASGGMPDYMLEFRGKGAPLRRYGDVIRTKGLDHYCSVIVSARRFICLTSGGATLAAALGVPVTALWGHGQDSAFHHSRLHTYINVNPSFLQRHYPVVAARTEKLEKALKRSVIRLAGM
ncbi:MAG: hypothetical protein P4K83_08660 [Terracidiphilus sp.]|nr:hypothetical protein [Terracidiphilus sp.]